MSGRKKEKVRAEPHSDETSLNRNVLLAEDGNKSRATVALNIIARREPYHGAPRDYTRYPLRLAYRQRPHLMPAPAPYMRSCSTCNNNIIPPGKSPALEVRGEVLRTNRWAARKSRHNPLTRPKITEFKKNFVVRQHTHKPSHADRSRSDLDGRRWHEPDRTPNA